MNKLHRLAHKILAKRGPVAGGLAVVLFASLLAGCATDPNEPGSENWYIHRLEEIEAAKAAGQISEGEYLSLKNQADATRAMRLNAVRYSYPGGIFDPVDYH